jgi:hypothetical protein
VVETSPEESQSAAEAVGDRAIGENVVVVEEDVCEQVGITPIKDVGATSDESGKEAPALETHLSEEEDGNEWSTNQNKVSTHLLVQFRASIDEKIRSSSHQIHENGSNGIGRLCLTPQKAQFIRNLRRSFKRDSLRWIKLGVLSGMSSMQSDLAVRTQIPLQLPCTCRDGPSARHLEHNVYEIMHYFDQLHVY